MANYASAALVTAQAKLAKKYQAPELRRKTRPVIQMALANEKYAIPDADELRKRESRPVEVHYKLRKAAGSATSKSTRHTGSHGDASKVTLEWNQIVETFNFSRKRMQSKVFSDQEAFAHEIDQAIQNIHDRLETAAMTFLYTNRCQAAAADIETYNLGTWKEDIYALEISQAEKDYLLQNIKMFFWGRHYRGELDMICDPRLYPIIERILKSNGTANNVNLGWQDAGFGMIVPSVDDMNTSVLSGQALVMPKGLFAAFNWNDQLNRIGHGRADDYVGYFTTMKDPYGLNFRYDVSVWSDRSDTSASGGHVQDVVDQYEITATFGWALPPLSEPAGDSVVHHVRLAAS